MGHPVGDSQFSGEPRAQRIGQDTLYNEYFL